MKFFGGERRGELPIKVLAALGGFAMLALCVVATTKLVGMLQASASSVSTLDVAITAFVVCELIAAALIAGYIFEHGSVGARRVGALLTGTAAGQVFGGLMAVVLAIGSFSAVTTSDGWEGRLMAVLSTVFWAAMGLRAMRNGWRQGAADRETSRNGPAIERIPE